MGRVLCASLTLLCYFIQIYDSLESSSKNPEFVHKLIFDEISAIKRKIWIDITSEIQDLSQKIDALTSERKEYNCSSIKKSFVQSEEIVPHSEYVRLLKGFNEEKLISRETEKRLSDVLLNSSELENKLGIFKQEIDDLSTELDTSANSIRKIEEGLENVHALIDALNEDFRKDIDSVNSSCFDIHTIVNTGFRKPSFVSEWMIMRAHDQDNVQRIVQHGLGVLPYKVEVQIRPTTGPNAGWIFHGDPAFQSDDDNGEVYGGIVYLYNETHVILVAPNQSNNKKGGVVINTGSANFRRTGNNHQTADEAYVRVKVWTPSDFPKPDFETSWLPLDIRESSLAYHELKHGLSGYPRFINVQIRCNASDRSLISEGLGATMMHRHYSNAGGVVYAFNDEEVRLWAGYLESTDNGHYRLLGHSDGWGSLPIPIERINIIKGEFRILSWDSNMRPNSDMDTEVKIERNTIFPEWSAFEHVSSDSDLLSFYVEATDGANKGFRFKGYGNSQAIDSPFGGVVYAFNSAGEFRTWRPNATTDGYLIHVHSPYGNGKNVQASNNGQYVSTLIRTTGPV